MTPPEVRRRVLLVDDQELVRRGLSMLLSTVPDLDVVAAVGSAEEALAHCDQDVPDVVVTDARMPDTDGIELTRTLRGRHPELPVLVLTTFDDDDLVRGALAAGASGFLLKDSSTEALAAAIRAVDRGGLVVDPQVARAVLAHPRDKAERASEPEPQQQRTAGDEPLSILTPAEQTVAKLVAQGMSNTEIARELFLAEGTVRNHVSTLLRKTGSRDRTALALLIDHALRGLGG